MSNDDLKYTVSGIGKSVLELLSQEAALPVAASIFTIAGFCHYSANCIALGDPYRWNVQIEDVLMLTFDSVNVVLTQICFVLALSVSLHHLQRWLAAILLIFMCAEVIFFRHYVSHDSWTVSAVMAVIVLCAAIWGLRDVFSFAVKRPINLVVAVSSIVFSSYMALGLFRLLDFLFRKFLRMRLSR